ncbi:putative 2-dehydropantoate 2-reductase [Anabaena cylindrica FACHB-243]|uniref:2-dehydropantoate 2-reductase n=1 Tax=Anabaena cylindrica (strain ATCC 27899 / PCC 7122) TaxID=272123 RepID=K9ZHB1_ANACC|nr:MULTISPECIES: putative 2-dehydropantoate 2-reductase [Anabaena]AFZ57725.1 ketopantoate reductase [Anabaena cylindrica PCC 7122]AZL96619.1 ketopantoate reductase [Anabaena sp. CCAP 1446/1C]MBD2419362.1 putative 2-dehydropantoate 2-reductase [Anabaena cylindrica FACHB-243]MBY5280634.1 putative 2-dehydropantoate 2-reductase [Anabaena sp. CCAP 1446/1C]MBY5307826.1 putative 2-dehydropantoate 2-reductase [Anabaena sp. CCAP 1446/1C]
MGKRTYAIIGTGALGGFYGAKLQKAGNNVHFLLKSDYLQVKQHGLLIESKDGDFILPQVNAYNDAEKMPRCDVVVVALKTTQNHLLPQILPSVVKHDGVVLVLQNGIGIEAEISQIVSNTYILGGLCFLCSNKVSPGHIHHLDYGQIALGEYASNYLPTGITDRMREIAGDFQNAGISIELAEDLLLGRWKKLVWNIPYNGLSVILNATTDELMADIHTCQLVKQLMFEVAAGAKSTGRIIPDSFIQTMLDYTVKMTPYRTSMKIDFDECRPLEVEAIFGNSLNKAESAGVNLPQIRCLYQQLQFLNARIQNSVLT